MMLSSPVSGQKDARRLYLSLYELCFHHWYNCVFLLWLFRLYSTLTYETKVLPSSVYESVCVFVHNFCTC